MNQLYRDWSATSSRARFLLVDNLTGNDPEPVVTYSRYMEDKQGGSTRSEHS
jgi:hypothetical protein